MDGADGETDDLKGSTLERVTKAISLKAYSESLISFPRPPRSLPSNIACASFSSSTKYSRKSYLRLGLATSTGKRPGWSGNPLNVILSLNSFLDCKILLSNGYVVIMDSRPEGRSFSVTSGGLRRGSGFISPFGFGGS